jgi:hypothetical protein
MLLRIPENPLAYICKLPIIGKLPFVSIGKLPFIGKLPIEAKAIEGIG